MVGQTKATPRADVEGELYQMSVVNTSRIEVDTLAI